MSISSIGNRPDQAMLQLKQVGNRGKSGISQDLKEKLTKIDTGEAAPVQEGGQQEKGVVRLLQEGHFQGVADVRLRINFYEQLQLSMSQKSGEVLKTESQELMVELEGRVQSFGEEFQATDQVEDMLSTFKTEAEGLLGSTGGGDAASVIGGLRDAFAGLLASLQSISSTETAADGQTEETGGAGDAAAVAGSEEPLLENDVPSIATESAETAVPAATEVATETAGPVTTEEPDAFSLALQNLQEWFDTEIAALEETLNDLQVLPEPSEQRGNGVAYDRFLEAYRGLDAGAGATRTHGKA